LALVQAPIAAVLAAVAVPAPGRAARADLFVFFLCFQQICCR
jgi:hypothetical protein